MKRFLLAITLIGLATGTIAAEVPANGGVQGSAVTVDPLSTSQSKNARASSSASMAMGMHAAQLQYHSGWFFGGLFLGLIGVGLSYTAHPIPAVAPDPA